MAVLIQTVDCLLYVNQAGRTELCFGFTLHQRPVQIRVGKAAYLSLTRFPFTNVIQGANELTIAMISGIRANDAASPRNDARHAQRNFIRLGATTAENHAIDILMVEARETFREPNHALMQVAAMDIECCL